MVGGTWQEAAARMAAVVEAWSRWGPSGDGSLPASLESDPAFEVVGRDEVGVVTRTGVRSPNGAAPAPSAERAEPAEVGS